jgi:hypothetical protein
VEENEPAKDKELLLDQRPESPRIPFANTNEPGEKPTESKPTADTSVTRALRAKKAKEWSTVSYSRRKPSEAKPVDQTHQLLEWVGVGDAEHPAAERDIRALSAELLADFDHSWEVAWERHIKPRHGSKMRALAQQMVDHKARSFFTIGAKETQRLATNALRHVIDGSQKVIKRWKSKLVEERVQHYLTIETGTFDYTIGREAEPAKQHVLCRKLKLVLGLGEDGFWIASAYPVAPTQPQAL